MNSVIDDVWPALPYEAWKDTYATLHMWAQIVGKVALAKAPPLNHSWSIAMEVTPRGPRPGRCPTAIALSAFNSISSIINSLCVIGR